MRPARIYDRLGGWYEWLSSGEETVVQQAIDLLNPRRGEAILEIGCGPGKALRRMGSRLELAAGSVTGMDLSWRMAQRALQRCQSSQVSCLVVQADARCLPSADERFDAILMTFTLELFPEYERQLALAECRRVLKTGGRMVVASLAQSLNPGWMERGYTQLHRLLPAWLDCRPIFLESAVCAQGFWVNHTQRISMLGLPVEIILAGRR